MDPFEDLNEAQREAVEHGLNDPNAPALLVIAGAGSGKTKTLAARVARLAGSGADTQRLLLLTFSRRAALEMSTRAGAVLHQALGLPPGQRVAAGTAVGGDLPRHRRALAASVREPRRAE